MQSSSSVLSSSSSSSTTSPLSSASSTPNSSSSSSSSSSESSLSSSSSSLFSGVVTIKDATLNAAIHSALGFSASSAITTENLKTLTSLQVVGKVTSLDGLQYATNLTEFLMYNDNVVPSTFDSIDALSALTKLKKVLFETGSFTNIDALKNLPLEFAEFWDLSALTNLDGLGGNSRLTHLSVHRAPVSRLTALNDVTFAAGADVNIGQTCASFAKDTESLSIVNALKAKSVAVTHDVSLPIKIGDLTCPADPLSLAPEPIIKNVKFPVTAKYNSAGVLNVEWATTDTLFVGLINTCEFYAELDYQLPRVPVKTLQNCPASGATDIVDLPFVGTNLTVVIRSTAAPTTFLKAKTAIDDSLIAVAQPVIRAIDWGQAVLTSNPKLVPNREALFRVHVTASASAAIPEVSLSLSLNGQTKVLMMDKPSKLPTTKQYANLIDNYHAIIPKEWMASGLVLSVNLNNKVKTITPTFADPAVLYLTLVPTTVLGLSAVIPDETQIQNDIKENWPFADVKLRTRAGFTSQVSQAANMTNLLTEIRELHVIDQDPSYYYGYFSGNIKNSPFGGQADMPGVDAIGMDIDNANLMPHELGHNFGRAHVNCNNPETVDNDYPYDPSIIGSLAVSLGLDKIYGPNSYADLMSYCKPKFVSDYSYIAVQDYIQSKPPKAFAKVAQTLLQKPDLGARRSLFITGQINSSDVVSLRRLVPLNASPKISAASEYQLKVVATDGTEAIYFVELPKVDHPVPQQEQYFSAIIPYIDLASLSVLHNGKIIHTEVAPPASVSVQQKPSIAPLVEERGAEVCLKWAANGSSATLIHKGDRSTTLFMDASNGNICVSSSGLEQGGIWKIILRKGLSVQEYILER